MNSRTRKMIELVTSESKNLLDLPKYESYKSTSQEEQSIALLTQNIFLKPNESSIKEKPELVLREIHGTAKCMEIKNNQIENEKPVTNLLKVNNQRLRQDIENVHERESVIEENENNDSSDSQSNTDMSINCSSGSEYVPDPLSDSESEKDDISSNEPSFNNNKSKEKIRDISVLKKTNGQFANKESPQVCIVDNTIVTFGSIVASTSKVEYFTNTRPWTKKNTCPYCFREVTHFPRHLKRNHENEGAVKEFLSLSMKDPKRKVLLTSIRRQGNFALSKKTNIVRPVRRPRGQYGDREILENSVNCKDRFVVCEHCMGYFSRNYLRRHTKLCHLRENVPGVREHHLSNAQLFSICCGSNNDFYSNLRLKNEVFPIMRNDDISKAAMEDALICVYGESLLCKHKRPQIRNVISNKMRELGRLLLSMRSLTNTQTLFDALKPEMFDNFISATKIISGYCTETRTFKASSLALHMGTTLKQVCDVATKFVIKKSNVFPCNDQSQVLKNIKRLRNLFECNWNSDLSSLALKNLNENKHNNTKLLPLTTDVVKFQQYVSKEAEEAISNLKQGIQSKAEYRRLTECVLGLTLLLNRKRIGEIQYLKVNTYNTSSLQSQQEEFVQSLSDCEKALAKTFKRVVTLGKGSKPVAILFSKEMQKYVTILLETRNLYVSVRNEYLFANPNTENGFLSGYHILKKLAERSGVSDKGLFTSTRLRKHIATVLQVLNVTENEMEQLANFMGHTRKTHQDYYRLPQDIYQTAKVSKLLLAINNGKGHLYHGKTIDEIDIDYPIDSDGDSEIEDNEEELITQNEGVSSNEDIQDEISLPPNVQAGYEQVENKELKSKSWTSEQKETIRGYFSDHIKNKKAPRKQEVDKFVLQHLKLFKDMKWDRIKSYVYNCYK